MRVSDSTLWFGLTTSSGYRTTTDACCKHGKPFLTIALGRTTPRQVIDRLHQHGVATLNVAGNRESASRGLGQSTERFLAQISQALGKQGNPASDQSRP